MTARMVVAKAELAKSYIAQPKISRFLTGISKKKMFLDEGKEAGLVLGQKVRCKDNDLRTDDLTLHRNWHLNLSP
jgi:hypothetical protein